MASSNVHRVIKYTRPINVIVHQLGKPLTDDVVEEMQPITCAFTPNHALFEGKGQKSISHPAKLIRHLINRVKNLHPSKYGYAVKSHQEYKHAEVSKILVKHCWLFYRLYLVEDDISRVNKHGEIVIIKADRLTNDQVIQHGKLLLDCTTLPARGLHLVYVATRFSPNVESFANSDHADLESSSDEDSDEGDIDDSDNDIDDDDEELGGIDQDLKVVDVQDNRQQKKRDQEPLKNEAAQAKDQNSTLKK